MLYFSGDIHGSPWGVKRFCEKQKLSKEDILVLLGDVGANYYGDWRDDEMKKVLASWRRRSSASTATMRCVLGI